MHRDTRRLAVAIAILLWLPSGCECRDHGTTRSLEVTADVQGRLTDGRTFDNHEPLLAYSNPGAGLAFGAANALASHAPIALPDDMTVDMPFLTHYADGGNHRIDLRLTVRDVPAGPSEIDLDETRAALDGWSGLQGHLSITLLAQDCGHGAYDCWLQLHATLDMSALDAAGDAISMTGAMLDAKETYYDVPTMCAQIGE